MQMQQNVQAVDGEEEPTNSSSCFDQRKKPPETAECRTGGVLSLCLQVNSRKGDQLNVNVSEDTSFRSEKSLETAECRTGGVLNSTLQKFQELRKRREQMSDLSQFKLLMDEKKKAEKAKQRSNQYQLIQKESVDRTQSTERSSNEMKWESVRQFFDINAHLVGPVDHGVGKPKCGLEENINAYIAEGSFEKAEELSNRLADREFAVRINDAFAAKRYAESQQLKKDTILNKRRKCLLWGFESKQRWEMKGNM